MDDVVYFRYIAIKLSSCTHVQSHLRLYTYVVCGTVLRTVLTDLKNKHDLDIYDLRNAQNFAKIL